MSDLFGDEVLPRKRCLGCKQSLPLSEFHKIRSSNNGRKYPYSYCKACGRANTRAWQQTHRGREAVRVRNLKRYGVSDTEYQRMHAEQNGLCAICGKPETCKHRRTKEPRQLCVDHCHKTGKVRKLLCSACNRGIACFHDNPDLLQKAIEYLQAHTLKL